MQLEQWQCGIWVVQERTGESESQQGKLCGDSVERGDAWDGRAEECFEVRGGGNSERRRSPLRASTSVESQVAGTFSFTVRSFSDSVIQQSGDLFVSAGAWIVFAADIDVLDDFAIAFISIVVEAEATALGVCADSFRLLESCHVVALADSTDSVRNVVQLVNQSIPDSSPANSSSTEHQRDDQHQFCRNNETVFVVEECAQHDCETLSESV